MTIRACIYSELAALARDTGSVTCGVSVDVVPLKELNCSIPEFDYQVSLYVVAKGE